MWPADKVLFTAYAVVARTDLGGVRLLRCCWHTAALSPALPQLMTQTVSQGFCCATGQQRAHCMVCVIALLELCSSLLKIPAW